MRFWLSEGERRPEPAPARADARKAAAVGTALFLLGLVAALVLFEQLRESGLEWWAWTAGIGAVLGVGGLLVVQIRRGLERKAG